MTSSRAILAGLLLILVASCGQSTAPQNNTGQFQLIQLLGPSGGLLSLQNGAKVAVHPGVLTGTQAVQAQLKPSETAAAPNPAWRPAPGVLHVSFASALPIEPIPTPGAALKPALSITMPYASNDATAILAARAPVAVITFKDGKTAKISPDGTFDTQASTVQVVIPRQALDGATDVDLFLATDGIVIVTPSPGPRYWNGTSWQTTPIQLDPAKRTLVFVHGIFSSVETAFPCVNPILSAGGYQQAVGLDYDWTQPPLTEAPILANFVNSLAPSTVDLEAHSYGTVVTLAALPAITKSLKNVALLGGPLPLNGSPQADPGFLRDLLVNLAEYVVPPSEVQAAINSGMVDSMATNSSTMQSIVAGTHGLASPPSYIAAAGLHPMPFEEYTGVHFLYETLFGFQPNDGVVEQISAQSQDYAHPKIVGTFLSLDHIQLECDPGVIQFVGSNITP